MKLKKILLSMIVLTGLFSFQVKSQATTMIPDIKSWPEALQMIAKEIMDKYGNPKETIPHRQQLIIINMET